MFTKRHLRLFFKRPKKEVFILFLILILALFLRTVDFQNNPKAMYGDGITLVYDAYSILKTGHDQKGNFMPLVFELGGSRPPGYVYATVPFTALFGPTDIAARSVSILSGLGLVLLMFEIGKMLYSPKLGLIAAGAMALSPWDLSLSRGPFETHFALFLGFLGVVAFFKAEKNRIWYLVSALSFALAMQTYATYRLTIPLFALALVIIYRQKFASLFRTNRVLVIAAFLIIVLSFLLSLETTFMSGNSDRFSNINIFTRPDVKSVISIDTTVGTQFDTLPFPFKKIFHSQITEYAATLASNYSSNFFFTFLFIHGDARPLHNPAEIGEFYWVDAISAIFGAFFLYKSKKNPKLLLLLIAWILITPIATTLVNKPHALRDSFMLAPILFLSSLGFFSIITNKKLRYQKIILGILGVLFLVEFAFFVDRFYFVAPNKFSNFWSYPAKQASSIAIKNKAKYKYIILSAKIDNMEFAYPVYAKLDPTEVIYQNQHLNTQQGLEGYKFLTYGNIYIGSIPAGRLNTFLSSLPGSVMYIGTINDQSSLSGYSIEQGADFLPDLVIRSSN